MTEPIKIVIPYTPQLHQKQWHSTKTRFLVSVCGRQIGKTTAAVNELIKRAVKNPGTRSWYVTNDYRQAKRNVWDELKRYIPREIRPVYNNSELSVTLPNKSRIELIGVENADSLRGAVVHFMILDEYGDFPSHVWPEVLRPMLSTTEGDVWFLGTPKGLNHFSRLYDVIHPDYTRFNIPSCTLVGEKVATVTNKYASLSEIQSAKDTMDPNTFAQEYLGQFTRPTGTVYAEWSLDHYQPFDYDPNLPLHISFDWGINDPTSVIFLQVFGSEVRVIDYYEASDANIEHFISVIRAKPYKPAELYTGDPAGKARTLTTGTSVIEILAAKGIHVRTKDGVKIPEQIRAAHSYMSRLFVNSNNPGTVRFRDCLLNYRYPEKKETSVNQENEIPIHDQYSHAMRAFEYWAVNYTPIRQTYQPRPKVYDAITGRLVS